MAETQMLNFGPEWLRALSGGGGGSGGGSSNSVASPPLSPALPKYKLADYRYGREEMLALYVKDNKIPLDLHDKEFLPILQEEPLPPLALVPFTEEEQRNFSMSVNSAAVLRLTGRGVGTVVGAPRGRSSSRGRGRGRGEGGFYQRSFDDGEGGFGRGGREMHRSQSWEERGDKRFEKPGRKDPDVATAHFQLNHTVRANYEEGVAVPGRKHEFTRSESENWRVSREEQNGGDDDEGGWRLAGSRRDGSDRWCPPSPEGPRSAGWDQRRRFPFDGREEDRGYRRAQDDERDSLPEWCLEDAEEETGTFDSSGAFLSLKGRAAELSGLPQMKKAPKEPILEEAELDFRPAEDCEAHVDPDETKETDTPAGKEADGREDSGKSEEEAAPPLSTPPCPAEPQLLRPTPSPPHQPEREEDTPPAPEAWPVPSKAPPSIAPPASTVAQQQLAPPSLPETSTPTFAATQQRRPPDMPQLVPGPLPFPAGIMAPIGQPEALPHDADDDEGLKHFEQEAEKMVAYLQEDDKLSASGLEPAKPAALPLSHEAALKWFYKDPQGEIQGPFSNQEMMEWFQAGYFTMTLLVKRGCDELFQPLGEIIKMWGRVPFTPGPSPPPMLGDVDQARLKRQQELAALNLYQLQQLQYQYLIRQQYAQALAQQQKAAALGAPQQPQQQQHLNLLLQQYQALKMRTSEQSLVPPVTRSMSVPDSGSVWELQNPSPQASASATVAHAARSAWEGGSVWDLPGDSVAQAPSLEQIQQLEKAKAAAKLEQERKEAELRAKREEEERKRREEALLAQQEEERKRREEDELARRQQEEALRLQQEQEEALRRQKEEEEEEARRLQERKRREEEERRQREELLRKQEEERKKQEELEALRRLEEEKRLEEEARLLQQEEQKKREQDVQRQRQQEALRRLQQQQQQQQLAQMKLPSSSKWGQQAAGSLPLCQAQSALSLAEIQKLEEERERQALEERHQQQQELMRVIQQQQQQQQQQQAQSQSQPQSRLPGWGSASRQPSATPKSLLEIQREEAQQMKQRKEAPQPGCPQQTRTSSSSSSSSVGSVWGSASSGSLQWGTDAGSIWSSPADASNANLGFWDEAAKEAATTPPQKNPAKKNKSNANLSHSSSGRANKKAEEEEKLLKLFQGVNQTQDGFTQWCEQALHTLNTANNLDVPTFTSFLKEVESPYEVHDYVRAYLGDTPESKEFAKHFLERRAKQNANHQTAPPQPPLQPAQPAQPAPQQKAQQQPDSVWGGTQPGRQSIFQSNHSSLQQARFETVTSGKKKKKQKMVRADPSLLGFSVNASSERLNMGEIETVEDF